MVDELPKTLAQLLTDSVISMADQRMSCSICQSRYLVFPSTENAVELPCKHVFGVQCISKWLSFRNSCPLCRQPVLDVAPATARGQDRQARHRQWLQELSDWQLDLEAWQRHFVNQGVTGQGLTYTKSYEPIFWDLCEAIVRHIEDPAVRSPREFLRNRSPLHKILGLGSFSFFANLMRGPDCELKALAQNLPNILADPAPFDICMAGVHVATRTRPADANLIKKMAAWLDRIRASRDRLRVRCTDRVARAYDAEPQDTDRPPIPRRSSRRAGTVAPPATPASANTTELQDTDPSPLLSRFSRRRRSSAISPSPLSRSRSVESDSMEISTIG